MSSPLRALSCRNYRLYFCGQAISLIGTWMTQTAMLWYMYQLTGSAFSVGLFGFMCQAPNFALGPIAGMLVDRMSRKHLLLVTQVAAMLQSFALAALAFTKSLGEYGLLAFGAFQGIVNAFDWPTRGALLIDLVEDRDTLGNAMGLNSSMFNLARFIGSALSGFIITTFGPAICYLIDGVSYGAMIVSLLLIQLRPSAPPTEKIHPLSDMLDGVLYVWNHPAILAVLRLVTLISFFGSSYYVLIPQFASDVFHGDARALGFLMSSAGCGALAAGIYLSMRSTTNGLGRVIVAGGSLLSVMLITLPWVRILPIALACVFCIGLGSVLIFVSSSTTIQLLVSNKKRGRVTALFTMAFTGTLPIASLMMGWVSQRIGASNALGLTGSICLFTILRYQLDRPSVRAAIGEATPS
ncbi:MAG TPA: MFS transporter [Chthoniobacterales bacterium]|nr:MFS transporter [Chthoniobacterales bacterium]